MSAPSATFSDSLLSLAVAGPVKLGYRYVFSAQGFSTVLVRLQLGVGLVWGRLALRSAMACMTSRSSLRSHACRVTGAHRIMYGTHIVLKQLVFLYCLFRCVRFV